MGRAEATRLRNLGSLEERHSITKNVNSTSDELNR